MKKVAMLAGSVALTASMVLVGTAGAVSAPKQVRPAKAMISLKICSSGPLSDPSYNALWVGVQHGYTMALLDWKNRLKKIGVSVSYPNALHLDDGQQAQPGYSTDQESQNALTCLGNHSANTVAYLGTLNSGATLYSEPIINRGHMVMISPSNTNPDLTAAKPVQGTGGRKAQEPLTYNHTLKHVTFFRTVTTDKLQGPAGAVFAHKVLHENGVYVVNDGSLYGVGLATYFQKEAKALHMKIYGTGTDDSGNSLAIAKSIKTANPPMVYCGCNNDVPDLPRDLRAGNSAGAPYGKLFMGGDALFNSAWLANKGGAGPGAVNNSATSVGPDPSKAAGFLKKDYLKYFKSWYKKNGIGPYDAPAYDAAAIVMLAIWKAAKHHMLVTITNKKTQYKDRDAIDAMVAGIKYTGATGTTRFDKNGDTTNKIVSVYRVKGTNVAKLSWIFGGQLKTPGSPT